MAADVARRGLLQAGVVTGGLALVGLGGANPALAGPTPNNRPAFTGMLGQHVRLNLARGAIIRMAELDHSRQLVRELGEVRMPLTELYREGRPTSTGAPLQRVCERAQALALALVSEDWGVSPDTCVINHCGIVHAASGRTIGYKTWVDVI